MKKLSIQSLPSSFGKACDFYCISNQSKDEPIEGFLTNAKLGHRRRFDMESRIVNRKEQCSEMIGINKAPCQSPGRLRSSIGRAFDSRSKGCVFKSRRGHF